MKRLTFHEWNKLIEEKKIEDLSGELRSSFLMVGQMMRAKIKLDGIVYLASAWQGDQTVVLVTVEDVVEHHANHGTEYP